MIPGKRDKISIGWGLERVPTCINTHVKSPPLFTPVCTGVNMFITSALVLVGPYSKKLISVNWADILIGRMFSKNSLKFGIAKKSHKTFL